jgi:hypothetical protein
MRRILSWAALLVSRPRRRRHVLLVPRHRCFAANNGLTDAWVELIRGANQRWRIEPLTDGTSRIVNTNSGKVLDVSSCGTADGANIQQHTWLDNACQRWTTTATDGSWMRLGNPNSGKVADVADCNSADGTDVRLWTWPANYCQQWSLQP